MSRKAQTPKVRKLKARAGKKGPQGRPKPKQTLMPLDQAIDKALLAHQAGKLAEAEQIYRQVLSREPNDVRALHYLGVVAQQTGHLEKAAHLMARAITLKPDYIEAHSNLGNVLRGLGRPDEAEVCYRKALEMKPDYQDALHNLGNALRMQGKLEEAAEFFRKAIELAPGFAEAHNNLGVILMRQGDQEEALNCFRKASGLRDNYLAPLMNLGLILKNQERLVEAMKTYEKAVKLDPAQAAAHHSLADLYRRFDMEDKAISSYEKVLELVPGHSSARHMLAALRGETVDEVSPDHVTKLFDHSADRYDEHQTEELEYGVPGLLRTAFDSVRVEERVGRALDLGCGTGLCGAAFQDLTDSLRGVDISPQMIAKARDKEIYEELITGELIETLGHEPRGGCDMFLAADVAAYMGGLEPLFQAVGQCAKAGAWFLLSVEGCDEGCQLLKSGRFAHSASYVEELAAKYEFQVVLCENVCIRTEDEKPAMGEIFVLKLYDQS